MRLLFLIALSLLLLLASGCIQGAQKAGNVPFQQQPEENGTTQTEARNVSEIAPVAIENNTSGTNNASVQGQITIPYYLVQSKEGEMCGGAVGFACEQGLDCVLESNQTGAGGVCRNPKWNETAVFHDCPSKRGGLCLPEYKPVCGRYIDWSGGLFYRDYPNPCLACAKSSNAIGYFEGRCASMGKK